MKLKTIIVVLLVLLLGIVEAFAQDKNLSIQESFYGYWPYHSDAKEFVWCLEIKNNSSEAYLTWVNPTDNQSGYGDIEQIINFFRRSRPMLIWLWYHAEFKEKVLGQTFVKRINPGETFTYFVICSKEEAPALKSKISIVDEKTVLHNLKYNSPLDSYYLFDRNSICIKE